MKCIFDKNLMGASAFILAAAVSSSAIAGGFSIREQSASSQGASFAGNAAGYDLSTIFWNPAGVAIAGPGVTTETHAAILFPDSEVDPTDSQPLVAALGLPGGSNDIGKTAFVPSSYGAWRINDQWTIGYGFNAPFGLATEADDKSWAGQYEFREAELLTYNFNPVVGYQLSPTFSIGVGLQVQYTDLELKQAAIAGIVPSATDPTAKLTGDDWSVGFTLGLLWRPLEGTSIGVGYRSRMNNTLEGDLEIAGTPGKTPIEADFDLPDILTISLRQNLSHNLRLLGTFEWTNWSILQTVAVKNRATGGQVLTNAGFGNAAPLQIEANWDDGYFLSGGLEYDYSDQLTLRGGVAYEWSPTQEPAQRLVSIPDSDRIWLSVGATYNYNENVSIDLAYTHIFFDDETINRPSGFLGDVETSTDIIAASLKMKWGPSGPFGILDGITN